MASCFPCGADTAEDPDKNKPGRPTPEVLASHGTSVPWFVSKLFDLFGTGLLEGPPPPGTALDTRSVFGTSPYKFTEVVPDSLWIVEYTYQPDEFMRMIFIGDYEQPALRDRVCRECNTPAEKATVERDLEVCLRCLAMTKAEMADGGLLKAGLKMVNYMPVAKMADGKLLLYSPVHVDAEELGPWLAARGGVGAIFAPSDAHTLFAQSAQAAYPDATLVAGLGSTIKLRKAGVRVDADYSDDAALASASATLAPLGCVLHRLDGDPNHELVVEHKPSGALLTCDLLYCDESADGTLTLGRADLKDSWEKGDAAAWSDRLWYRMCYTKEFASGLLPVYRWQFFHDPLFPITPKMPPGSMATFGRAIAELISLPSIKYVLGSHVPRAIPGETGIPLIKKCWAWTM